MTNQEIIMNEAILNNIFTEEEFVNHLNAFGELPLHTFAGWKQRGFSVKKGEKAAIATSLWKFKKSAKKTEDEEESESGNCYLCKAYLFTANQVEAIK